MGYDRERDQICRFTGGCENAFGASEYGQAPWRADDEVDVLKRNGDSEILYVIDVEKMKEEKKRMLICITRQKVFW